MEWLWLGFGVLGGWAMLSLMGNERQRQIIAEEARLSNERAAAQIAARAAALAAAPPAAADPSH
ncbi:MAG: hypothetical protein ACTHM6_04315 [Tepidisphaeraceae bacterium]